MSLRNIFIILLMSLANSVLGADRVSTSFFSTPLPVALRTIELLAGEDITINFSFKKLEDYTITTDIIDATPLEAVSRAIGFYPIKVSCQGSIITVQPVIDTDYKVCGRLVNDDGEGVDFATITLMSMSDSAVIACGVSNLRGDFVIPVTSTLPVTFRASRLGYKMVDMPASVGQMGNITMEIDPYMLKTLTAYADKDMITNVGAITHIRIEGTPYSNIGTLADLLPNLPGFNQASLSFGIEGVSPTKYYINGREVSQLTQLNMIRSEDVKSIDINKAPGADYPSDAAVVVNISTIKSPNDFINLKLNNSMLVRHKLSDVPSLDFKMQLGKFTTNLNYSYDYLLSQSQELDNRIVDVQNQQSYLLRDRLLEGKTKGSRLNWSGELQFNPRNRLGLYFYLYSLKYETQAQSQVVAYDIASSSNPYIESWQADTRNLYSGTLSYDYAGKIFTAHVAQDIAYTNPYSNTSIDERESEKLTSHVELYDKEYFIATTNVKLGLNLPWKAYLTGGARFSYIESNTYKLYSDNPSYSYYYNDGFGYESSYHSKYNFMNVNETTAQAFLSLNQRIGNFTINPGIRYEYVDRWISDDARIDDTNVSENDNSIKTSNIYDNKNNYFLPSLLVKYASNPLIFVLNYGRRIVQPTFSMLNSGIVYEDNFTYANSNPELKSSIIDEIRFTSNYRGFTFDLGYKNVKNPIAEVEFPIAQGAVVYRTPINVKRYYEYDFNLSYASSIGRFGYYAAANLLVPGWHSVTYSNQKATFNAQVNLNYKINDKFSLYTNFNHLGSCRWMVYDRLDSQIWNFGVNASLLCNDLHINIEATNLLGRDNRLGLSSVYNGVRTNRYVTPDNRGVSIRVSYTLFNKNIRTNMKRGNVEDILRIEK